MRTTLITHSGRLSNINHNWKISKPASYAIPLILFNILTNWYLSELYFWFFFRPWLTLTAQWSVRKTRRILKKLTRVPSKSGGKEKGCAQVEDPTHFSRRLNKWFNSFMFQQGWWTRFWKAIPNPRRTSSKMSESRRTRKLAPKCQTFERTTKGNHHYHSLHNPTAQLKSYCDYKFYWNSSFFRLWVDNIPLKF